MAVDATLAIHEVNRVFPAGTSLIAGEPEDTTFTGLDGDTDYVAWGQVSGVWRQLGFRTPEEA